MVAQSLGTALGDVNPLSNYVTSSKQVDTLICITPQCIGILLTFSVVLFVHYQ